MHEQREFQKFRWLFTQLFGWVACRRIQTPEADHEPIPLRLGHAVFLDDFAREWHDLQVEGATNKNIILHCLTSFSL